jgi:hypothetical protein
MHRAKLPVGGASEPVPSAPLGIFAAGSKYGVYCPGWHRRHLYSPRTAKLPAVHLYAEVAAEISGSRVQELSHGKQW